MIRIEGLSHRFSDGSHGLWEVSLKVREGQFALLAGANGSGKTLLFKHLLGIMKPTEGQIFYQEQPLRKCLKVFRRDTGMIWQESDVQIIGQTVAEEVGFGLRNQGVPEEEIQLRVHEALQQVHLDKDPDFPSGVLSGGEKRRLIMASMIAERKKVLLLDEPFSGLDWTGVRDFLSVLLTFHQKGGTILLISHDLDKFLGHVEQVFLLNQGRLIHQGSPVEIWSQLLPNEVHPPHTAPEDYQKATWLRDKASL
jgi:biotin transport system ATP-binding protein